MLKICSGATAIGLSAFSKEYENQCIDEETKVWYRLHSTWKTSGVCGEQTCVKYAGQLYIEYKTCGHIEFKAEENCRIVEDNKRSFPKCCPSIICDIPKQPDNQNSISNEINIDDYGQYDELDQIFEDHFLSGDEISEQQHPVKDYESYESYPHESYGYESQIVEDHFLSGDEISEQQHPDDSYGPVEYMIDWDTQFPNFN